MVVAFDINPDFYPASGSYGVLTNPPAIYSTPDTEQVSVWDFTLYQGSGGEIASLLPSSLSGTHVTIETEPPNKLKAAVNDVCSAFKLTKDELADVLNVRSRKTLYNWIKGESVPRKAAMAKLFDLLVVSKAWNNSGLDLKKAQLREPVVDSKSILDLLSYPSINQELILFAGTRINLMSASEESLSDPFA